MKALLLSLLIASPVAATPLPMVCELTSEEVPSIKVRLTERTAYSLDGELFLKGKSLGTFQTGQSNGYGSVWWHFTDGHDKAYGKSVLFKDDQHWNLHRRTPRPSEVNRVLFAGFGSALWYWESGNPPQRYRGNRDLLNAAEGFWSISGKCLGGRILRS